jgi:hypothetical protein
MSGTAEWMRAAIAALPEESATGSRDFGRGYAKAVRDVLGLLDAAPGDTPSGLPAPPP